MSKVTKQISVSQRKLLLAFLSIALIASIASSSVVYVYAQGVALSTTTISGGPYPGAPSYTIFTEGGTYYAKDANGAIAFSSTNASYVINTALAAGVGVHLLAGTYTLTAPIIYNSNTKYSQLTGESKTATLINGLALSDYALQIGDGTNNAWQFTLSDLTIYGGTKILESAQIYVRNVGFGNSTKWSLWIEDSHDSRFNQVEVYYGDLGGLKILAANGPTSDIMFSDSLVFGSRNYLMNLQSTSNTNIVRDSTFSNSYFEVYDSMPSHGVLMNGTSRVALIGNTIAGTSNNTSDLLQITGTASNIAVNNVLDGNHIWRSSSNIRYACYVWGSVNYLTATGNDFYGVTNDLKIDSAAWRFSFEQNTFATSSLSIAGSLGGYFGHNNGFVTEASGLATSQVNGDVITFPVALAGSPQTIQLTTNSPLQLASWSARSASNITLYLQWANGTTIDVDHTPTAVSWYVSYAPP